MTLAMILRGFCEAIAYANDIFAKLLFARREIKRQIKLSGEEGLFLSGKEPG